MSSKFVRKFRRELTANPKKAGALGLMVLVAGYFWAPLLKDWFGSPTPASTATSAEAKPATATTTTAETPKSESAKSPKLSWQQVAARLDADPLMKPAAEITIARDPFQVAAAAEPEKKIEQLVEVAKPRITPEAAGLSLTSTLVGPKRSVARVLGKSYGIGDRIAGQTKDSQAIEFVVAEIHPRRIVLERDGRRFDLEIPVAHHGASGTTTTPSSPASPAGTVSVGPDNEVEEN